MQKVEESFSNLKIRRSQVNYKVITWDHQRADVKGNPTVNPKPGSLLQGEMRCKQWLMWQVMGGEMMDAVQLSFLMNFLRPSESIGTLGVIDTRRVCIRRFLFTDLQWVLMRKIRSKESEMGVFHSNSVSGKNMKLLLESSLKWYKIFTMIGKGKQMSLSPKNIWRPVAAGEKVERQEKSWG